MTEPWTRQRVLDLAPDSSSAGAGQGLAKAVKWVSLGKSDRALWGELKGSGKEPYRVRVDLAGPAFKCSCPSRKFPCKHALGLMLIHADDAAALAAGDEPPWVSQWLADREDAVAARAARSQQREQKPVDEKAQARRQASREAKVQAGLQELSLWLQDLVRQGLAAAQTQPPSYWEATAARLEDAQAPGLARMVRQIGAAGAAGAGWQEQMLARIGRLHLLVQAYARLDRLPSATQADVRGLVGWTVDQAELLRQAGVPDQWLVLAQVTDVEERLRVYRTWLWGMTLHRPALVLQFEAGPQPRGPELSPGSRFDGQIVFFPGASPLRAVIKSRQALPWEPGQAPRGHTLAQEALREHSRALALNPWIDRWPMALSDIYLDVRMDGGNERWSVRDGGGHVLPIVPRHATAWQWLALGGGGPLGIFGEWNGWNLTPLAAWTREGLWVTSRQPERTSIIQAA